MNTPQISGRIPYFTKHDLELIRKMAQYQIRQIKNVQARPGGQQLNAILRQQEIIQDLETIIEKIEKA